MAFGDTLIKRMRMKSAIEFSKIGDGKPNAIVAYDTYMKLYGKMSAWDRAMMMSLLQEEKTNVKNDSEYADEALEYGLDPEDYDTEEELVEAIEEEKYGWRIYAEDGWEYNLDPEDFETEEEYEEALQAAKYGWRDECEDGFEYGVDPEDYETAEEYEEALTEAKYGWRDECEDGSEYDVDPEDYETAEEYEEALTEAKYGWRDVCEDGSEYDVDPEDYETEDEYNEALEAARVAWRKRVEDGSEYDLDPEDYESEEEYNEALKEARVAWRDEVEDTSKYGVDPQDYETKEEYLEALAKAIADVKALIASQEEQKMAVSDKEIRKSDFSNHRRYLAACEYRDIKAGEYDWLDKEDLAEKRTTCEFILNHEGLIAADYLTLDRDFLCAQAVKDHFELPCTFPDEVEDPKTWLEDMLKRIARRDIQLALKVWHWCLQEFLPYIQYTRYDTMLQNDVLAQVYRYPDAFVSELITYAETYPSFVDLLVRKNTCVPCDLVEIIGKALETGKASVAQHMFESFLSNPHVTPADIETFVDNCIGECETGEELETMELFRDRLYVSIKGMTDPEITSLFNEWDTRISEYIDETERECDQYAYTRQFAWRAKYKDNIVFDVDPVYYDTEQEYLESVEEQRAEWLEWHQDEIEEEDDSLSDELQEAVILAIEEVKEAVDDVSAEHIVRPNETDEEVHSNDTHEEALIIEDQTVYELCGVVFHHNTQVYHYRTGGCEVNIGDEVVVPVGRKGELTATVVSVGKYRAFAAPYPVEKTKTILGKKDPESDE